MSVASHTETSNNVHSSSAVSHKHTAPAAVAMTTSPATAAASAGDRTAAPAASANWPQVCHQYFSQLFN